MKKSFKVFLAALVMAIAVPASASAFEWSECWCNYGGRLEKGDVIVNVGTGLWEPDVGFWNYYDSWFFPTTMVEVQVAQPIWKLPFTFGGYAGYRAFGYKVVDHHEWIDGRLVPVYNNYAYCGLFLGGEAAYHIQFPPEGLDLYVVTRLGASIPFINPGNLGFFDYFNHGEALGANWYFGDTFGVNLEVGYPMLKAGISLQF